ncbi:hypothetical protein pb186bvf_005877 [Paramecium bursaria]
MYRLLRSSINVFVRGPKKAAKQEAVATSDDLINIWKDRQDPEIKEIEQYPVWLLELALPLETVYDVSTAYETNDKPFFVPRSHISAILRGAQRERIHDMNEFKLMKRDLEEFDDNYDEDDVYLAMKQEKEEEEFRQLQAEMTAQDDSDDEEEGAKPKRAIQQKEKDEDDTKDDKKGAAAGDKKGAVADKKGATPAATDKKAAPAKDADKKGATKEKDAGGVADKGKAKDAGKKGK